MPVQVPETMKRIVHFGSRNYGQLTAGRRMLPQFLICGGQRCGTTSLYRALAAHPAVIKAVLHKGVHYFDVGYHHGLRWYRGHFPLQRRAERVRAEFGVPAQTFESSPYYMYHPHALARIAADLPGVRLVVLVRDPVERAYSQHAHEVARGFEPEVEFARALELEQERLDGQRDKLLADPFAYSFAHQHHAYRARGEYIEYIEPMARLLGRDRIHVIDSSEFFERPEPVYDAVVEFLGLPHVNSYPLFDRHNARPRNRLDDSIAQQLAAHYAPYDERLANFLGYKPSWMRQ
ncbi:MULTISPECIES: sulfotransferase domain-containing protein [Dactylosporangium]|uniref:Deacetylase sulfotransferase n=2 Tax=Dactylosporangium TaxID=35753 RepID=A0A9W6KGG2_9ACTN|nr:MULTISPECIES: sulfotransferase domain-containing protein [Dactylosporangium]UAB95874.1 sulfotransferase domain-containing protein [Dactylosporangium vinaceum]UWZ44241.1 sulfotransferase domain-containing protein [Dactylosporangium matsuzakiense]GLK99614.1 deacetylase sulfotransferase [Dactylosporangium matsuzakiense]